MNCSAFELWLDTTGGAPEPPPAMLAHVVTCARCRAALAAARSIDAALAAGPPRAPAGFAAQVMRQVTSPASPAGGTSRDPHAVQGAMLPGTGVVSQGAASWWRMFVTDPACVFAVCCAVLAAWLPHAAPASFALGLEWTRSFVRLGNDVLHGIPAPQSAVARASLWTCAAFAAFAATAILGHWTAKARHD